VNSNFETARALAVTQSAAATAALAWVIVEAIHHHKATSLGLCSGILAGLVAITPAAGVVNVAGSMVLGALASLLCYFTVLMKTKMGYDDSLDVFGIHGCAGIFGAVGLSLLLRHQNAVALAARFGPNWSVLHQFGVQVTAVAIAVAYAAIVSFGLVVLVDKTVGFRLDIVRESAGMDHSLHGEHGYGLTNLQ
jgi:Amt family ammonium transporter